MCTNIMAKNAWDGEWWEEPKKEKTLYTRKSFISMRLPALKGSLGTLMDRKRLKWWTTGAKNVKQPQQITKGRIHYTPAEYLAKIMWNSRLIIYISKSAYKVGHEENCNGVVWIPVSSSLFFACSLHFFKVRNTVASFSCTDAVMGLARLGHVSVW